MNSGSSQQSQQTTTANLTPQQQTTLGLAMPNITAGATPPSISTNPNNLVAPFNPEQIAGQNQVLKSTSPQRGIVGSGANASQFLTSGEALQPSTNPAEAAEITAATLPIEQNLTESTLPALRSAATGVGQTGSSREGVAEGIASRGASQAEGATAADIANRDYTAGLNAMVAGLGLVPSTAGAQAIPGETTSAVGDVQQQQEQNVINALNAAHLFNQESPLATGEALVGAAGAMPGGSTTATGTTTGRPSTLAEILGIGSLLTGGTSALLGNKGISSVV